MMKIVAAGVLFAVAMPLTEVRATEEECTNAIPFVVWSSRSGLGPFKEIQSELYKSAGWLKWLFEPHRLYCEVPRQTAVIS